MLGIKIKVMRMLLLIGPENNFYHMSTWIIVKIIFIFCEINAKLNCQTTCTFVHGHDGVLKQYTAGIDHHW